jgi:transposase
MERRARRAFTDEFKARAVDYIPTPGKSTPPVCRGLDLTETSVRRWVAGPRSRPASGRGLTSDERQERARLPKENRTLREERQILKTRRPSLPPRRR